LKPINLSFEANVFFQKTFASKVALGWYVSPFQGGIIKLTEMRGTTPVYVNYDYYKK